MPAITPLWISSKGALGGLTRLQLLAHLTHARPSKWASVKWRRVESLSTEGAIGTVRAQVAGGVFLETLPIVPQVLTVRQFG